MIAKELIYQDTCTIFGREIVDEEGDTSYEVLYEGLCDFQPNRTILIKGIYTQAYPTLYLPYYDSKVKYIKIDGDIVYVNNKIHSSSEDGEVIDFVINGRVEIKRFGCGKSVVANIRSCTVENVYDKLVGIALSLADVRNME